MAKGRILEMGRLLCLCPLLATLGATLGGCSLFGGKPNPTDQCADLMIDAYPDGDIDITHKSIVQNSLALQTVTIQGARNDVPPTAAVAHDVAVECKFDHDVLTDFHWSKPPFR